MAWECIGLIKNNSNEVKLAVVPLTGFSQSASTYTQFSVIGSRVNIANPDPTFLLASATADDVMNQVSDGVINYVTRNDGTYNDAVLGAINGQGVNYKVTRYDYGTYYNFPTFQITKYFSLISSALIGNTSLSFSKGVKYDSQCLTPCLIMNADEQKIFAGYITCGKYYYANNHTPSVYDSANYGVTVYHPSNGNLWDTFKDSIPSGGGGSDPYEDGGYSTTTPSGTGDFDDSSDSVSLPSLPSISAIGAGVINLNVIDENNLANFMSEILNPSFTGITTIAKFFNSPIEAIACLNYMPYTPSNNAGYTLEWVGEAMNVTVGEVKKQYEEIDCGSVDLTEFYGSCLDFSPYTTIQLVLPFAGSVDIDPDEFNGKTISVKYHIDNYTGAGLALVSDGDRVLLQVPCSVANPIPLTSKDYSAIIASIASVVVGGVSTIAAIYTGGASVGASIALAGGFAASSAGNVMSAKLHYNHGGSLGMGTGMFGVLTPYLIIKRPSQCLPEGNGNFQGYPTFVTENLGDVSGFTKIAEIHLDSMPITTGEKDELLRILKGGVIF